MPFISITRLRLRSVRFLPLFAVHAIRAFSQTRKAAGFRDGSALTDRQWTFWTMTSWDDQDSMRRYMMSGSHKTAMPYLTTWCDEASVVHWDQANDDLPSWSDAGQRMRESGRASKVRFPSPTHASLDFRPPRVTGAGPIRPAPRG